MRTGVSFMCQIIPCPSLPSPLCLLSWPTVKAAAHGGRKSSEDTLSCTNSSSPCLEMATGYQIHISCDRVFLERQKKPLEIIRGNDNNKKGFGFFLYFWHYTYLTLPLCGLCDPTLSAALRAWTTWCHLTCRGRGNIVKVKLEAQRRRKKIAETVWTRDSHLCWRTCIAQQRSGGLFWRGVRWGQSSLARHAEDRSWADCLWPRGPGCLENWDNWDIEIILFMREREYMHILTCNQAAVKDKKSYIFRIMQDFLPPYHHSFVWRARLLLGRRWWEHTLTPQWGHLAWGSAPFYACQLQRKKT